MLIENLSLQEDPWDQVSDFVDDVVQFFPKEMFCM